MKKLPDAELEIMLHIWEAEEAVTRNDIQERMQRTKQLAPTTILSFLSRLTAKGFLRMEKDGKSNRYYPLISKGEYAKNESKTILERFFGSSVTNFVAHLNEKEAVDQAELKELRELLERLSDEDGQK